MSKTTLLCVVVVILGIVGFFAARILYVQIKASQTSFKPQAVHMELQPPKDALQAKITSLVGDVKKEGRNDTDFTTIHTPTTLLEGEAINTGVNGSSIISFPHIITLTLENNTELDYLNGLPNALVVRQPSGTVIYTTSAPIKPFSIRSLGLLTQMTNTSTITMTTDSSAQTVVVKVRLGTATLAYSDANNTTQVQKLIQGQQAIFDYNQSTLIVK